MGKFDLQIETAYRLIAKNGQSVTWKEVVITENEDKPWKPSAGDSIEYPVSIAFFPDSAKIRQTLQYIVNTEVPEGFEIGLMPAVDFVPALSGMVERDGETLRIKYLTAFKPNGEPIFYLIGFEV